MIKTKLLDARNLETELPVVLRAVNAAKLIGLDCETEDSRRHAGLNTLGKYDPEGLFKKKSGKLIFDMRRTTMCGFSVYPEGSDTAWYVNLNHADEENRVPWNAAQFILRARAEDAYWLSHNAPFELTVFRNCYGVELDRIICTLQMLVSCYGPDEYHPSAWHNAGMGAMAKFLPTIEREALTYTGGEFKGKLADAVVKIIAKESKAAHSYNGFCKELAWGYGLKRAVKTWFDHDMSTFQDTLGEAAHMGQLTGEQVAAYGAEDAYWVVPLFHRTLKMMTQHSPNAINTFFSQENPMIHTFSDIWRGGMRVDLEKVRHHQAEERTAFAERLRDLKVAVRRIGKFSEEPEQRLFKREDWYRKNYARYRQRIIEWAYSPNEQDPFRQVQQVRSAVSNAWAAARGEPESKGLNLGHYMPMRVLLYDLVGAPLVVSKGKVQSNGEARGRTKDRLEKRLAELGGRVRLDLIERALLDAEDGSDPTEERDEDPDMLVVDEIELSQERLEAGGQIVDLMTKMASIEQRMKLYITPYLHLTDPETSRMYPVVSSMLAARRCAASYPNPMQLQKRGDSTYVRGFYVGDDEEHLMVSLDWSAIELVIIGEESGDREFARAFKSLPHQDLHMGTAATLLGVEAPELTETMFSVLRSSPSWEDWMPDEQRRQGFGRLMSDLKGQNMDPSKAYKYWRTEAGKGGNFNYWYSGWLSTIGDRFGWSMDQTQEATQRFRDRFPEAEAWRVGLIEHGRRHGWVELKDGHRRNRFEATDAFFYGWMDKWPVESAEARSVMAKIASKIQRRSHNQMVNAAVQGTCSTIAKRSIVRITQALRSRGWTDRDARFLVPIHDELVFSVHWSRVAEFVELARSIMIDHPELFRNLALDASPSVGLTFEPWHLTKAPFGQIELFEAPRELSCVPAAKAGGRLDGNEMQKVARWLFEHRKEVFRQAA